MSADESDGGLEYVDDPDDVNALTDGGSEQATQSDMLESSDCGDPPLGIIDNGISGILWRGKPKGVVKGQPTAGHVRGKKNLAAHDGEKRTVVKHQANQQTALATTTVPQPPPKPKVRACSAMHHRCT